MCAPHFYLLVFKQNIGFLSQREHSLAVVRFEFACFSPLLVSNKEEYMIATDAILIITI